MGCRDHINWSGRQICSGIFGILTLCLIIFGIVFYSSDRSTENNFVESICLVLNATAVLHPCYEDSPIPNISKDRKNLDILSSIRVIADYSCYLPIWFVEYNDSTTSTNDTRRYSHIKGVNKHEDYNDAIDELHTYPVSIIN